MSHPQVPSAHRGFVASQNLQEKHFPDWTCCMHAPLHDWSPLAEDIYEGHPFLSISSPNLYLISVMGPSHLILLHEEASSFWKQHLQTASLASSPHTPASAEPNPQTQEHVAELTSSYGIASLCRGHKLTALVWIPFLDQTLLETLDFLHFFHFPSVT